MIAVLATGAEGRSTLSWLWGQGSSFLKSMGAMTGIKETKASARAKTARLAETFACESGCCAKGIKGGAGQCCYLAKRAEQKKIFENSQLKMNAGRWKTVKSANPDCTAIYKRIEYSAFSYYTGDTKGTAAGGSCSYGDLAMLFLQGSRVEPMRALFDIVADVDAAVTPRILSDKDSHWALTFAQKMSGSGLEKLVRSAMLASSAEKMIIARRIVSAAHESENGTDDARAMVIAYAIHLASAARLSGTVKPCGVVQETVSGAPIVVIAAAETTKSSPLDMTNVVSAAVEMTKSSPLVASSGDSLGCRGSVADEEFIKTRISELLAAADQRIPSVCSGIVASLQAGKRQAVSEECTWEVLLDHVLKGPIYGAPTALADLLANAPSLLPKIGEISQLQRAEIDSVISRMKMGNYCGPLTGRPFCGNTEDMPLPELLECAMEYKLIGNNNVKWNRSVLGTIGKYAASGLCGYGMTLREQKKVMGLVIQLAANLKWREECDPVESLFPPPRETPPSISSACTPDPGDEDFVSSLKETLLGSFVMGESECHEIFKRQLQGHMQKNFEACSWETVFAMFPTDSLMDLADLYANAPGVLPVPGPVSHEAEVRAMVAELERTRKEPPFTDCDMLKPYAPLHALRCVLDNEQSQMPPGWNRNALVAIAGLAGDISGESRRRLLELNVELAANLKARDVETCEPMQSLIPQAPKSLCPQNAEDEEFSRSHRQELLDAALPAGPSSTECRYAVLVSLQGRNWREVDCTWSEVLAMFSQDHWPALADLYANDPGYLPRPGGLDATPVRALASRLISGTGEHGPDSAECEDVDTNKPVDALMCAVYQSREDAGVYTNRKILAGLAQIARHMPSNVDPEGIWKKQLMAFIVELAAAWTLRSECEPMKTLFSDAEYTGFASYADNWHPVDYEVPAFA